METTEIIRKIMEDKKIKLSTLSFQMEKSPRLVNDRIRAKNIVVNNLLEILRFLDYELVIVPRGKANKIEGAFAVSETNGDKK